MATHLALVKAEYAYEAQAQEELTLIEDSLYYLLEAEDEESAAFHPVLFTLAVSLTRARTMSCRWHKVKLKTSPSSDDPPQVGLVPANYLVPAVAIGAATAVYAYEAQTEDELVRCLCELVPALADHIAGPRRSPRMSSSSSWRRTGTGRSSVALRKRKAV